MEFNKVLRQELEELKKLDRYRTLPDIAERRGTTIVSGNRPLLNLSSNDYLGLGDNAALLARYMETLAATPLAMTSSSSRLLTGNHPLYEELEKELASLYKRKDALLFNSGYHANIGILPALAGRHDLIVSDRLNHASIIDGMKIAESPYQRFRHGDYDHLEELLTEAAGKYRQIFIITESVFSMDGDLADLARLVAIKQKYHAFLIVDEAHGVGVFGEQGLGLSETSGVVNQIDIIVGTFGKAFASTGAFAIMDTVVREYLINTMRPFIFTTALPPVILGWSLVTLREQRGMRCEREALLQLASKLRQELSKRGFDVPGESQIVPVIAGSNNRAVALAGKLREKGFLCMAVRPPTVPENSARIRISLRATLCWEDICQLSELIGG